MNNVILMGRLTADPEFRQTPGGVSTCSFNLAVDRGFKDQNGERQADFIGCVAWRQTAEFICKYFSKGSMIAVEGELRTRNYDDKRYPDVKHYVTEVFINKAHFCGSKSQNEQNGSYQGGYQQGYSNTTYSNSVPQSAPQTSQSEAARKFAERAAQAGVPTETVPDLSDFEEIISDSDLPF